MLTIAQGTPRASAIDGPQTLTFSEPFTAHDPHYKYVDLGKKGMSRGDLIIHTNSPGIDARTGRRIATSDGIQTILSLRRPGAVAVSDTIYLPDGQVQVAGTVRYGGHTSALAVTGGTGRYRNARGQVTITEDIKHKRNLGTLTILP